VVIPAYRGRALIADCIRSVERALEGLRAEIVVVESSGDGAVELIRQEFPGVRVLALSEQASAGAARNRGVTAARGKQIAFVDQDCVVPPDWISRLEELLARPGVGAVGGSIGFRNPSNFSGAAVYFLEFLRHFPSSKSAGRNQNFLIGCNLACRRDVFNRVQFPDRTLAEDVLFSELIRREGLDLLYAPQIQVSHWNREGWREFVKYNLKMGCAAAHYQAVLDRPLDRLVRKLPALALLSPAMTLPRIAMALWGQWTYLLGFLALSPACLVGNVFWSIGLCRELRQIRLAESRQITTHLSKIPR
jgi:GT2 family glycosyltransferase